MRKGWIALALMTAVVWPTAAQTRDQAKAFVKKAVEFAKKNPKDKFLLVKEKGSGWIEYKELNPAQGNKVMKKVSWVELFNGMVIGAGIYE